MSNSEMLFLSLIFLGLLGLVIFLALVSLRQSKKIQESQMKLISEVLNRLQSSDLPTYRQMNLISNFPDQNSPISTTSNNVGFSDVEEAKRLMEIHGLGQPIFDTAYEEEGLQDLMRDLGVRE
jgi:hypothetical protein